jgi:hypothetical protein
MEIRLNSVTAVPLAGGVRGVHPELIRTLRSNLGTQTPLYASSKEVGTPWEL